MASGSGIETNRIREFSKYQEDEDQQFFLPGTCTECHKIPSEDVHMMSCGRCRLVWYCGKECQKIHWKNHREFCKAASSAAEEIKGPGSYLLQTAKMCVGRGMDFEDYLDRMVTRVGQKLNREIDRNDLKIIYHPKVCEICRDANPTILKSCKNCYIVFYCSKEHAKQDSVRHKKFCPEYLLTLQCYKLVTTKGVPVPGNMPFNIPIVSEYKQMSWTIKDYIKPTFEPEVDAFLSEWVSYPLSLLYALEHTGLKDGTKKINEIKKLTVLMFDAFDGNFGTMSDCGTWEYMLHLLPKLRTLNIILYEPDFPIDNGNTRDLTLCSDCISRKCKVKLILITDYQWYKRNNIYKKPDIFFNHDVIKHYDIETCLPYPEPEIPLILFNVNKQIMEKTFHLLRKTEKLDILLPLGLNPFRSMQPDKQWRDIMEDGSFLHYRNSYIIGLRRQIKGNILQNSSIIKYF